MGKTLRNIIAGSMIVGSLLVTGCDPITKTIDWIKDQFPRIRGENIIKIDEITGEKNSYEKALKIAQNPSSIYNEEVKEKETPKPIGLEFYFFQGDELRFLELSHKNIEGFDRNPQIVYIKNLKREKRLSEEMSEEAELFKILSSGTGKYTLPQIEDYSKDIDLLWGFLGFESQKDRENYMREKKEELLYPTFIKGDVLTFIVMTNLKKDPPSIYDTTDLSEKQKLVYIDLIFDYAKRTGMTPILAEDETISNILLNIFKEYREDQYKLK